MRRVLLLGGILAVGGLSVTIAAYQAPASAPKVVEVEKLKDNLFLLKGGGGNTAVFVQSDGITVVDTKNPGWGQPILDKIKELSNKPVVRIINTHTHGDHVSGNVEFPATVDVVVQENTAANMKKMAPVTGLSQPGAPPPQNIFDQNKGRGLPKQTFKDNMTLGSGADQIDLY
jgi:glyoxylase-like metal-dependent hydrolase (beta-lactamase superfamily II)